jgi:hypothetical protein
MTLLGGALVPVLLCRRCGACVEPSQDAPAGTVTPQQAHTNFHDRIDAAAAAIAAIAARAE